MVGIDKLGDEPRRAGGRAGASTVGSQLADMTITGNERPILRSVACNSRPDIPGMSTWVTSQLRHSGRIDAMKCSALSKDAEQKPVSPNSNDNESRTDASSSMMKTQLASIAATLHTMVALDRTLSIFADAGSETGIIAAK